MDHWAFCLLVSSIYRGVWVVYFHQPFIKNGVPEKAYSQVPSVMQLGFYLQSLHSKRETIEVKRHTGINLMLLFMPLSSVIPYLMVFAMDLCGQQYANKLLRIQVRKPTVCTLAISGCIIFHLRYLVTRSQPMFFSISLSQCSF